MAGTWIINACREGDEILQEFDDVEQHIFSFCKRYDAENILEYDTKDSTYYPTKELGEEVAVFIDEYDNKVFWDELIDRMAVRDATKKHEKPTFKQLFVFKEKHEKEFDVNGIDRLSVGWKKSKEA